MKKGKRKKEKKWILIGSGLGIISSLYFVYNAIKSYSFTLGKPVLYTFTNHPLTIIVPVVASMVFWVFIGYLTQETIRMKNIVVWGAFLGGLISFFFTVLFIKLDIAGGLIQLSFITILGIICGAVMGSIINKIKERKK